MFFDKQRVHVLSGDRKPFLVDSVKESGFNA